MVWMECTGVPGALGEAAKMGASLAGCSDADCEAMVDGGGRCPRKNRMGVNQNLSCTWGQVILSCVPNSAPFTRIYAHIRSVNSINSIYGFRFANGIMASACIRPSVFFWLFFATAYTIPAKKPTPTAEIDPNVTGSPKNNIPEAATGSLFKAPTMLSLHVKRFNYSEFKRDSLPVCRTACRANTPCGCI